MAHELEIRDGKASFVHVGQSAWHGLGERIPEGLSVVEATKACRADYAVESRPVFLQKAETVEIEGGDSFERTTYVESKVARVTVRTDLGTELGRVSPDYTPVQNADAFGVLQPLLDHGLARIETGGVLRDGRDAWLLVQFDAASINGTLDQYTGNNALALYGLVRANHDGRAGVMLATTPIRVVCANTLGIVETGSALEAGSVRHTGAAEARLAHRAAQLFGRVVSTTKALLVSYDALRASYLDTALFRSLVLDVALPDPRKSPRFNAEGKRAESVVAKWEKKVGIVSDLWHHGKGHAGDSSAWEAYNGLVEALDHNDVFYSGGAAWKAGSLLDGTLADTKVKVYRSLLRHAQGLDAADLAVSA